MSAFPPDADCSSLLTVAIIFHTSKAGEILGADADCGRDSSLVPRDVERDFVCALSSLDQLVPTWKHMVASAVVSANDVGVASGPGE